MTNAIRNVTILGATGSIGASTLDVIARHPERYRVVALSGHSRLEILAAQCAAHKPRYAVVATPEAAIKLKQQLAGQQIEILHGAEALAQIAALPEVDTVMAAIVGAVGLAPTMAAVRAGKRVLLANKEALVMAGELFMHEVQASGAILLPVDSEHNAIYQSLPAGYAGNLADVGVSKLLLTASGGPFRTLPLEALEFVTPEQACAHPNWVMGKKISVDSATMMNKGLEVIEARWLFNAAADKIEVVIHPQSVIHSMVQYVDGSVLAQLGNPDMRTPIAHALAYPERIAAGVLPLDLFAIGRLDFCPPDMTRFPCLDLAYQALRSGGNAPAVLNAANEVAVAAFLEGRLPYRRIADVITATLDTIAPAAVADLQSVMVADVLARDAATAAIGHWSH
ncbi:MAG TPA: 1-deoxy-D-xylulose-5-phosphate reductoisomerase [Rhodocyclaceae bacterium]|jgi:1-deoxy-D-xylulose-5-phosphate reductoisomerase|nr:1-deoxy-D-xylulose-5-phosphate reductoisomerase [Rhodocyclaceae bacterium]